MRSRSPANSAASSPPVPARTSRMTLFSSAASRGSSRMRISSTAASILGFSSSISASAISAISRSPEAASSSADSRSATQLLVRLDRPHHRLELGIFLAEAHEIFGRRPGRQRRLDGIEALGQGVELVLGECGHQVGSSRYFPSPRPSPRRGEGALLRGRCPRVPSPLRGEGQGEGQSEHELKKYHSVRSPVPAGRPSRAAARGCRGRARLRAGRRRRSCGSG